MCIRDRIVPVPLHQRKKRLRGYNQSECLARGVSVVTGIPMDTKVVIRLSLYTHLDVYKRQTTQCNGFGSVAGAIACHTVTTHIECFKR